MDALSLDAARAALQVIPSDDRATWVGVAKALHDEYGEAAFDAWNDWSANAPNYDEKAAKLTWKSVARMSGAGKPVKIATLVFLAKQRGFKFNDTHHLKVSPQERARLDAERQERYAAGRAIEQKLNEAAAVRALAIWNAAGPATDHPYLARKQVLPHGTKRATEWVKEWTHDETGEIRQTVVKDALLIPIWSGPNQLASLQAIFPSKSNALKRDKDYLTDGRKRGCYFTIGRVKADTTVVLICEGFATGASLHQATGYTVMVAFDANNLEPVASLLRGKLPNVRIVICADNDQSHPPRNGKPFNPGVECGTAAGKAAAALVAVPTFDDVDGEPKDFNDMHVRDGLAAVVAAIDAALSPSAPAEAKAAPESAPPPREGGNQAAAALAPPAPVSRGAGGDDDDGDFDGPAKNGYFAILGYNQGTYYVFNHGKRQLSTITKGDMSDRGLLELAPLPFWEANFAGSRGGIDSLAASNFIMRVAHTRGIYDLNRIRGRGAWNDEGRMVFHHGGYLTVDGAPTDVTDIKSRYVYELDVSLEMDPAPEPMTSDEGEHLLDLAKRFRWQNPGSAALLAGWVALAPVCGALNWRPHIWITGGAGSGKSTVLNRYVHQLIGGVGLYAQGNSTEAGIRQTLKADARPVLFDESESNEENDARRTQSVLSLVRQASTESHARTLEGTAGGDALRFHIRSMFCLASILVALKQKADSDRLTVLVLNSGSDADGGGWTQLRDALYVLERDATLPSRLFRRAIDLLPVTLKNILVFTDAAAQRFGSQRDGDQFGTLLAGAWSLISTKVASPEEALELINRYDWAEHREAGEQDE